ncbi:Putative reductase 1 [Leucoagaricus sp. SymC.cos]|nr:Putative reductase 1 [Leucoagaricus sp. SymC.cos]
MLTPKIGTKPIPVLKLNNGGSMPAVGVGCWMGRQGEGDHVTNMVKTALRLGYRHIDTAANYCDEISVGQAIHESGVPRQELFVTTKLASEDHWDPQRALETSLKKLGLDYVDLYLLHWPMALRVDGSALQPNESPTFIETWHLMQELLRTGKTKAIGVSNLSLELLTSLLAHPNTTVVPAVDQVEAHPCLPQHELLDFCRSKGIQVVAYSPVGKHKFASDKDIQTMAQRLNITPAQVILSWGVQRGTAIVPKSEHEERLIENITVSPAKLVLYFGRCAEPSSLFSQIVELPSHDMETLDKLHLKPGMHRSVCGFHSAELGGSCFGWTYKQLGWGFGLGGVMRD